MKSYFVIKMIQNASSFVSVKERLGYFLEQRGVETAVHSNISAACKISTYEEAQGIIQNILKVNPNCKQTLFQIEKIFCHGEI